MPKHVVTPRWKKGESGNPSGRPKGFGEFRQLCRDNSDLALRTLIGVCTSKKAPPSAKVSAAQCLIEHGWGKATQTVNVNDERGIRDLTRAELLAILAEPAGDSAGTAQSPGGERVADPLH